MKKYLLSIIAVLAMGQLQAQKITGIINDDKGEGIIAGNVALMKSSDSSEVKYSITDANGAYEFIEVPADQYVVKSTYMGATAYSSPFTYDGTTSLNVPSFDMKKTEVALNEVVITRMRPQVQMKADRLVFNIDSTANSVGLTAMELMRKAPGVLVDKDDNISMSGKNGVRVYIDGKPSPLTGADLSEYLKSIQSTSIDNIELINNPSAKYDAAGNAGIINIVLKKDKNLGTNGTVNAGFGYGVYPKVNGGFTINNRSKHFNVFGSYNGDFGKRWNEMHFERKFMDTFYDQGGEMANKYNSHNYKAGVDYYLSKKSTIGAMINGSIRNSENIMDMRTDISYIPTGVMYKYLRADNTSDDKRNNMNLNANYQYNDNAAGKSLNVDVDYGNYDYSKNQFQPNRFYTTSDELIYENNYNIIAPTKINITSAKADWEQNALNGKLGLGVKTSFVNTDNDFEFNNLIAGNWVKNRDRSNEFKYEENVQAAYITYNRQFKGFAFQAGLRAEQTNTKGYTEGERMNGSGNYEGYDTTFTRNYLDFFPSIGLTFNKNPMNQISFNYSRRIDRPNYQDLNPFEMKMDEYSYRKGNVNLLPQYTNSFSITHTLFYRFTTKLDYSHVSNMFAEFVDTTEGNKMFQTKENLATQDIVSLNFSAPFQYKKWSAFFNLNTYYSMYKAEFGPGKVVDQDVFSFNVYMQNTYKFNDWLSGELSGWYTAPSIWQGIFKSIAMGGIDIGAQATILNGQGTLKASMGDVFRTMKWGGRSDYVGQQIYAYGRWESQQFRLNFTYRFGNKNIKSRQRATGVEDEKSRTGTSEGMGGGR